MSLASRELDTWAGEKSLGFFLPIHLHVISFDFDSGVGIPVTLTFWPRGGHPSKTPNTHAWLDSIICVERIRDYKKGPDE